MKLGLINLLGLIIMLTMNYLANGLPLNGLTTGEISALYPNTFVPAGLTFSIWGIIYLFLIGHVAYPLVTKDYKIQEKIGYGFFITCLINASWILVWHYLYLYLSLVLMLIFLITLIMIYKKTQAIEASSKAEKWLMKKPYSLYLGWISVATVANITAVLVYNNFTPPSPEYWTVSMILALLLIVWSINKKYHDIALSLVVIWALTGIILKQNGIENGSDSIIYTAIAGIAFTTFNAFYYRYRKSIT